jgi:3'-phosphoadenosine 5'-phosphosulfate sulfotransferase (PAPS reductase)/FAD synthetase
MLRHLIDANPDFAERCEVVFSNTGREMPETLDFVQECGERWGVPITWVEWRPGPSGQQYKIVGHNQAARDGEPFAALIRSKAFLPNQRFRICTQSLKVRPARDYLRSIGWDHWSAAIGIRKDEPHRHEGKSDLKERWRRWMPLVTAGVSKGDVISWWKRQPFDLRLRAVRGNSVMGNCDGCFLKSEAHAAALARDHPERHAWWERMEAETQARWFALSPWARLRRLRLLEFEMCEKLREAYGRPIPRSVIEGFVASARSGGTFSKRFARRDLRAFVERQGDWIFESKGTLCQADDGECVM